MNDPHFGPESFPSAPPPKPADSTDPLADAALLLGRTFGLPRTAFDRSPMCREIAIAAGPSRGTADDGCERRMAAACHDQFLKLAIQTSVFVTGFLYRRTELLRAASCLDAVRVVMLSEAKVPLIVEQVLTLIAAGPAYAATAPTGEPIDFLTWLRAAVSAAVPVVLQAFENPGNEEPGAVITIDLDPGR
jgi:hypothetical protein